MTKSVPLIVYVLIGVFPGLIVEDGGVHGWDRAFSAMPLRLAGLCHCAVTLVDFA